MSFQVAWAWSAVALLAAIAIAGRSVEYGSGVLKPFRILIDDRDRFSLNRLQLVLWTVLVLTTLLALFVVDGFNPLRAFAIPTQLLGLLGISFGTGAVAGATKEGKNMSRASSIGGGPAYKKRVNGLAPYVESQDPHFAQVYLEEEGQAANKIVSITKFQNFIFTLVLGTTYVVLALKTGGYPLFDERAVWLIGISHATYIGGKVPDKS